MQKTNSCLRYGLSLSRALLQVTDGRSVLFQTQIHKASRMAAFRFHTGQLVIPGAWAWTVLFAPSRQICIAPHMTGMGNVAVGGTIAGRTLRIHLEVALLMITIHHISLVRYSPTGGLLVKPYSKVLRRVALRSIIMFTSSMHPEPVISSMARRYSPRTHITSMRQTSTMTI